MNVFINNFVQPPIKAVGARAVSFIDPGFLTFQTLVTIETQPFRGVFVKVYVSLQATEGKYFHKDTCKCNLSRNSVLHSSQCSWVAVPLDFYILTSTGKVARCWQGRIYSGLLLQ